MTITLRTVKGTRLTIAEADGNITDLDERISTHVSAADPHTSYALQTPVASPVTYQPAGTTTIVLDGRTELFYSTALTDSTTWAFSGAASSGKVSSFILELTNGGAFAQVWPVSVTWEDGEAPTLTAAGVDILIFYTRDGGTTWRGFVAALDTKVSA